MLTLGVIGDFGVHSDNSVRVAKLVKSWKPAAIVTTGDNLYILQTPSEKAYACITGCLYKEYMMSTEDRKLTTTKKQLILRDKAHNSVPLPPGLRFLPCVGNHDYPTHAYCRYFGLPTYYGIQFKSHQPLLKLISLNNYMDTDGNFECKAKSPTGQRIWLEKELAASADVKWIIIYFHYPQVCSISPDEENCLKRKFPFHKYPNVALILSGHKHIYERLVIHGITNVIVGTSGHSLYHQPEESRPESKFFDNSGYGGLKLEVENDRIKGSYYVTDKLNNNVTLKDEFVIESHSWKNESIENRLRDVKL